MLNGLYALQIKNFFGKKITDFEKHTKKYEIIYEKSTLISYVIIDTYTKVRYNWYKVWIIDQNTFEVGAVFKNTLQLIKYDPDCNSILRIWEGKNEVWANQFFSCCCVYYFSLYLSWKYHIFDFEAGAKVVLSDTIWCKSILIHYSYFLSIIMYI